MKVKIEFTKDFANKGKGDFLECDGQLASQLVRNDKVAKYTEEQLEIFSKIKEMQVKRDKELSKRLEKAEKAKKAKLAKAIRENKKKQKSNKK